VATANLAKAKLALQTKTDYDTSIASAASLATAVIDATTAKEAADKAVTD
jgi:hypothetical protein